MTSNLFALSVKSLLIKKLDCNSLASKPRATKISAIQLYNGWIVIADTDFQKAKTLVELQYIWTAMQSSKSVLVHSQALTPNAPFQLRSYVDAIPAQTPCEGNAKEQIQKHCSNRCDTNMLTFWICGLSLQGDDAMIRMLERGKYMHRYWSSSQTWYNHMHMRHARAKSAFWATTQMFSEGPH